MDSASLQPQQRLSRKVRDYDMPSRDAPQPTDLDDRLTAFRRKQAGYACVHFRLSAPRRSPGFRFSIFRLKEKLDREQRDQRLQLSSPPAPQTPVQSPTRADRLPKPSAPSTRAAVPQTHRRHAYPQVVVSGPPEEADHESFSRLKITSKPKLFNPDTDPIPLRRTAEPDSMSEAETTNLPRNLRNHAINSARQLFDHRRDDPVHFKTPHRTPGPTSSPATHTEKLTPTPKSSGDYISAGSASSYAASISSSNFSLSTDGSSQSSALFDRPGRAATDDSTASAFSQQLKFIYRHITSLESKIQQEESEDQDEMDPRVVLKGRELSREDLETEKWLKKVKDHKR